MNKINLCKKKGCMFCCFKFILYRVLVANLFRGSFLGEGLLCNRGFAAKLFFKRYIAVVIGRSPWRRPGIVFDNKASLVGQVFRFGIGSLLCRFSAKKRPISFALYPRINPTARFDGGQNGVRRLCKTSFTAVLCRLHIVRTSCICPCEATPFCPHPDLFLTAVLLTVDIFLKIEYHICNDMPSAVSDDMRQNALCGQDASEAERKASVCGLRTVCRLRAFRTQGVLGAGILCLEADTVVSYTDLSRYSLLWRKGEYMSKGEQKKRMSAGEFYNPMDKELVLARTRARYIADKFNRSRTWNLPYRTHLIKKLFPNGTDGAFFEPSIRTEYGFNVKFGKNFYMNFDCQLLDVASIEIGDNVMFGPRVVVATPCHPLVAEERISHVYEDGEHDWEYAKPVKIGNNVWVASCVTICGGVTIGDDSVIAAGSVVTRDIPSGVLAGGVPCKVIRPITDNDRMFEKHGIKPPIK